MQISWLAARFGVCGLVACSLAMGCAASEPGRGPRAVQSESTGSALGEMSFQLTLGDDSQISTIDYSVSAPDMEEISGEWVVETLEGPFNAVIGAIPAGLARTLTLSAVSDSGAECEGTVVFDVVQDATTVASVVLRCNVAEGRGLVEVGGEVQQCPLISTIAMIPPAAEVGEAVTVTVGAGGYSLVPQRSEWTANAGRFESPTALSTRYVCETPGAQIISLTAMDEVGCSDSVDLVVECLQEEGSQCGNGVVEFGEECDGSAGCSDLCLQEMPEQTPESVCGNGVVEEGEECDGGYECDSSCTLIDGGAACGNGVVEADEDCDGAEDCTRGCTWQAPTATVLTGTWLSGVIEYQTTLYAPLSRTSALDLSAVLMLQVSDSGQLSARFCELEFAGTDQELALLSSVREIQTQAPSTVPTGDVLLGEAFPATTLVLSGTGVRAEAPRYPVSSMRLDLSFQLGLDVAVESVDVLSGSLSLVAEAVMKVVGLPVGTLRVPADGEQVPVAPVTVTRVSSDAGLTCVEAAAL